jgi:hypothetical protein
MSNENNTGLVFGNDTGTGFELSELTGAEKLELHQRILAADAAVKYAALPILKSQDIIGVPVTIIDARFSVITEVDKTTKQPVDKTVVNFMLRNETSGEVFSVTKGANNFNNAYVEYFDARRGVAENALTGFEFVTDSNYSHAGNDAIVLRKIQPQAAKGK